MPEDEKDPIEAEIAALTTEYIAAQHASIKARNELNSKQGIAAGIAQRIKRLRDAQEAIELVKNGSRNKPV